MKAILFDSIPPVPSAGEGASGRPSAPLVGSTVFRTEVVRAILRYGTFDRYYFVEQRGWAQRPDTKRTLPEGLGDLSRAQIVGATDIGALADARDLVLASAGPDLFRLLPIRTLLQRPAWPLFGVSHSLNGSALGLPLLSFLLDDYGPHDVLICSTAAGKRAIEKQLEAHREALAERTGVRLDTPVQLPIVPLGIDPEPFHAIDREAARTARGVPGDAVVILFVGRFSALTKGDLLPLILAFVEIHRTHPRAQLVLAGDDSQQKMAETLAARAGALGLAEHVRVVPGPSEIEKRGWLAAADIFVALSDNVQETFGLTVAEAMMAGLPVVASDWNGYRDLIRDGVSGLLVPTCASRLGVEIDILSSSGNWTADHLLADTTGTEMDALTRALAALIDDDALRTRLGAGARREALQRFAWPHVVSQYERIWTDSLAQGADRVQRRRHGGAFQYSYEQAFGHYPTRWIEPGDLVAPVARSAADEETAIGWSLTGEAMFSAPLMRQLLETLRAEGPLTVEDLVQHAVATGRSTAFIARAHIGRMAKYGLVTTTPVASEAWAQPGSPALHVLSAERSS